MKLDVCRVDVVDERVRAVAMPLGTIHYAELVTMLYAPLVVALTAVVVASVRHRLNNPTTPKR